MPNDAWGLMNYARSIRRTGEQIRCSLFGRVSAVRANGRELVGVIPDWLQREARKHGLKVIGADFKDDCYTFEITERAL